MPGLTLTPLDVEDDGEVEVAYGLLAEDEIALLGFTDDTPESFRVVLTHPDSWVPAHRLARRDGRPVGVMLAELDRHGREVFLDAYAPVPDRVAVLTAMLQDGVASARSVAAEDPPTEAVEGDPFLPTSAIWQVLAGSYVQDTGYAAALVASGFRAVRRFWRMRRDLGSVSPVEPDPPAGVTRRVVDGDADRRTLHRLFSESFAEHFGSAHDHPYEEWIAGTESAPGADPARWWIASLDGVDAGFCVLDDSRAPLGLGHVRLLGVVGPARGRGIARWLLACAAVDAAARGHAAITLSVDGENTTGATALYESVGYTIDEVFDVWCRPVDDVS